MSPSLLAEGLRACQGLRRDDHKLGCVTAYVRERVVGPYMPFTVFTGCGSSPGTAGYGAEGYSRILGLSAGPGGFRERSPLEVAEEIISDADGKWLCWGRRSWLGEEKPGPSSVGEAAGILAGASSAALHGKEEWSRFLEKGEAPPPPEEAVLLRVFIKGVQKGLNRYPGIREQRLLSRLVSFLTLYVFPSYAAMAAGQPPVTLASLGAKYYLLARDWSSADKMVEAFRESVEWLSQLLPELSLSYSASSLASIAGGRAGEKQLSVMEALTRGLYEGRRPLRLYSLGLSKPCSFCGLRPAQHPRGVCSVCSRLQDLAEKLWEIELPEHQQPPENVDKYLYQLFTLVDERSRRDWEEGLRGAMRGARAAIVRGDVDGLGELVRSALRVDEAGDQMRLLKRIALVELLVSWMLGWGFLEAVRSVAGKAGEALLAGLVYMGGDDIYAITAPKRAISLIRSLAESIRRLAQEAGGTGVPSPRVGLSTVLVLTPLEQLVEGMRAADKLMHEFVKQYKTRIGDYAVLLAMAYAERSFQLTPSRALRTVESMVDAGLSVQPLTEKELEELLKAVSNAGGSMEDLVEAFNEALRDILEAVSLQDVRELRDYIAKAVKAYVKDEARVAANRLLGSRRWRNNGIPYYEVAVLSEIYERR